MGRHSDVGCPPDQSVNDGQESCPGVAVRFIRIGPLSLHDAHTQPQSTEAVSVLDAASPASRECAAEGRIGRLDVSDQ